MKQLTKYWFAAAAGIGLCLLGILHGTLAHVPAIATKYGVAAVALSFLMLFISRGTATKALDAPGHVSLSAEPLEARIDAAALALQGKTYAERQTVGALVACLEEAADMKERALTEAEEAKDRSVREARIASADHLERLVQSTIAGQKGAKRQAVETLLEAKLARRDAMRNRVSLASLLDTNRKETMPIAALSIFATLCSGFADYVVEFFLRTLG